MSGPRICQADMETGRYVGDGEDGVYVSVAQAKDGSGWYTSSVVDCNSHGWCDSLVTDDGPYPTEAAAAQAGYYGACDWCSENGVEYGDDRERQD